MPELPEVEHLRRSIETGLLTSRIDRVELRRNDIVRRWPDVRGKPADHLLAGSTIISLERKGKQLAIVAEGGHGLVVQLGMSGQVRWVDPDAEVCPRDHVHVRWAVSSRDGERRCLEFRDPRRFGGISPFLSRKDLGARLWAGLGVDAVDSHAESVVHAILAASEGSRRPLKSLLLDQSVVAGIGNIYADEALFASGLHPRLRATRLNPATTRRLVDEIQRTLRHAIESGGSTLRDYVDASGRSGSFQNAHRVYGRAGLACLGCGKRLQTGLVAGRTTVWCPTCQRSTGTRSRIRSST